MSSPAEHMHPATGRLLVLYDGTCGFCDASIQWLLSHDTDRRLRYAALQGACGAEILRRHHDRLAGVDSIVLVEQAPGATAAGSEDEVIRIYSDAALRIASVLPFPWSLARHLRLCPRAARDAAYRLVARHRLRLFGKLDSCRLPLPEERELFLS